MLVRPSHFPTTSERSAWQKLCGAQAQPLSKLESASGRLIEKMIAKGWVAADRSDVPVYFRITQAGGEALTAKMPIKRQPVRSPMSSAG